MARRTAKKVPASTEQKPPKIGPADRLRGQRIRALRLERQESQAAFGDHFGVEQPTVGRWEKGWAVKRAYWPKMAELAGQTVAEFFLGVRQAVPLLSWVAASGLALIGDVADAADAPLVPAPDLPAGDWFALEIDGDSMNRIACHGSIIFVNRRDKALIPKGFYVFESDGEATFKRYMEDPARLEPYSTNPAYEPIYPKAEVRVIGRVWRVQLDLK